MLKQGSSSLAFVMWQEGPKEEEFSEALEDWMVYRRPFRAIALLGF